MLVTMIRYNRYPAYADILENNEAVEVKQRVFDVNKPRHKHIIDLLEEDGYLLSETNPVANTLYIEEGGDLSPARIDSIRVGLGTSEVYWAFYEDLLFKEKLKKFLDE